jgi:hypothetical protein
VLVGASKRDIPSPLGRYISACEGPRFHYVAGHDLAEPSAGHLLKESLPPSVFSLSDVRAGQPTLCNAEGWSLQDTLRRWSSRAMGVTAPKNASPKTKSNIIAFAPRRVWQSATNLVMALRCRWPQSQLSPPFLLALQSARQPQSASELQRANARSWSRRASSNGATGSRT